MIGGLNMNMHLSLRHRGSEGRSRLLLRGTAFAFLIPCCFLFQSDSSLAQSCANERGWFIRIIPNKTEAPGVRLEIGFGGVGSSHQGWREWRHGQPSEFPAPTKFLHANEIWIKGISLERGKNVAMCVGFNDHITQEMCFDKDEQHEASRDDHDGCGC
jgi:hypothetical protein